MTSADITDMEETESEPKRGEVVNPIIGDKLRVPVVDGDIRGKRLSVLRAMKSWAG